MIITNNLHKMNTGNLQQPSFSTIQNLFSNNFYSIPSYQRKYSWGNDEAVDLINDILQVTYGKELHHFFGSIVTFGKYHSKDPKNVIDGQQRLTTSLVFIATIRDLSKKLYKRLPKNKSNFELGGYINTLIHNCNNILMTNGKPSLIIQRSIAEKQDLNYSNYLNWIITKHGTANKYISDKDYKPIKLLRRVRRTFLRKLRHGIRTNPNNPDKIRPISGQFSILRQIFNSFANNFYVIIMDAPSRAEALTIYMTLNNRGKDLSTADIVKGRLAGILEDNSMNNVIPSMMKKWNAMSNALNSDSKIISHFIGEYWEASHSYASSSQLSRAIITTIKTPKAANTMINELLNLTPAYNTLLSPTTNSVYNSKVLINNIDTLNNLHLIQYYPVLLAMYHQRNKFNETDILQVMHDINNIEMRHIIHHVRHTRYSDISNDIWNNKLNTTNEIINKMNKYQLEDDITTKTDCLGYSHTLRKSGTGMKTLMFIMAKDYAYQYHADFNNGKSIHNDIFNHNHKLHVIRITNNIDSEYKEYIGNYVLIESPLYIKYKKSPNIHTLRHYLSKSSLLTNRFLADNIIHYSPNLSKLVQDRQKRFADDFVNIWK